MAQVLLFRRPAPGAISISRVHKQALRPLAGHYRFDRVDLDTANVVLRVDGRVRVCPPKVFDLLLVLCQSPGQLISRSDLMDRLWPGGQVVADEALTQLIFRTRALLGPYGERIRTVRGLGLRLESDVRATDDAGSEAEPRRLSIVGDDRTDQNEPLPHPAAEAWPGADERPAKNIKAAWLKWSLPLLAVAVLAMLAGTYEWRTPATAPAMVDEGYGIELSDVHASQAETAGLVAEALKSDENGERARAEVLLEALHRSDTRTPIPALFLALWHGAGSGLIDEGNDWLREADERIGPDPDVYMNLLRDYFAAEINGTPEQIIDQAGALLDIRPNAWRMRAARAHLMEFIGMREAALKEIQHITVPRFEGRKRNQIIADRAAFGDAAGAKAILDAIPPESDPSTHAFLSGRVAWSMGDFETARVHFERAAKNAYSAARIDIYRRSLMYVGAIEVVQRHDAEAMVTLETVRNENENKSLIDEIDLSLFLAQLHAAAGETEQMRIELQRALEGARSSSGDQVNLASFFAAWRLLPDSLPPKPADLPPEADAQWRAMEAYVAGDLETAENALAEARLLGIGNTRMADEARWLELMLGLAVTPESTLDPPFPPLSRVVLRRQIRDVLAANGEYSGPTRP